MQRIRTLGETEIMNVIYYCDWFEEYTARLALSVVALPCEVTLIVRECSPEFRRRRGDEAELHNEVRRSGIDLHLLSGKYSSIKSFVEVCRIYRGKRKAGYKYFHLQQTGDPRFLWLAVRFSTILTLHEPAPRRGVEGEAGRLREFIAAIVQRLYRYCAGLIVVHTTANLKALTPTERRKAIVIPHGVDARFVHHASDSKTILFFGRAAAYKGVDTLLAAMNEVWKFVPDARLRILASPGDYKCELDAMDSRICATWDGYSNRDLESALSAARAVCLPYVSASGTGVGSKAYGSGLPIIASDLEGLRELVSHQDLLVQPGNIDDLARALISVLTDDYAVSDIDEGRTWPLVAKAHTSAYESLPKRLL